MRLSDSELFLASMADVTPLKADDAHSYSEKPKAGPTIAQLEKRKAAEQDLELDANYLASEYVELLEPYALLSYKKDGVQEAVFKNLRLAKYQIDATLELSGMSLQSARKAIFECVRDCQRRNIRVLLVRHGIGLKSKPHPALLKSYSNKWLQELPEILAFHSAQKHHGGSGATYVLMKKSEDKKQENRERHAKR